MKNGCFTTQSCNSIVAIWFYLNLANFIIDNLFTIFWSVYLLYYLCWFSVYVGPFGIYCSPYIFGIDLYLQQCYSIVGETTVMIPHHVIIWTSNKTTGWKTYDASYFILSQQSN